MFFILASVYAQEKRETINREFDFAADPSKVFIVNNINGFIKVEGYDGSKILLEAKQLFKAKTQADLDNLVKRVSLKDETYGDTLEVYVDGLCNCDCGNGRRYNWNSCNWKGDFNYDFTIKVPKSMNVALSTVNKGDIEVKNVLGSLKVNNINGAIYLDGVAGAANVRTINGDVKITYVSVPPKESEYYTLNGDLTVYLPSAMSSDMTFKSFNGKFYTDFDIAERLPPVAKLTNVESGKGTTYKIEERTAVRVGKGGVKLNFETFNGDIIVRKNQ